MGRPESNHRALRARREPPPFRHVVLERVESLTPRMIRVTFGGSDLEGLVVEHPAASVRLLLPLPETELAVPSWNGNEFLLPDGSRPTIRTFTPRRVRTDPSELDLDIVLHGGGAASEWVRAAVPGDPAAVSGPGRGYVIDHTASAFLLAGDETAIPAISQLLEVLPVVTPVQVHIEVAHPDSRLALPDHPRVTVEWHDLRPGASSGEALVAAVGTVDLDPDSRVWVAGEAAAVQRIRRYLFEDRQLAHAQANVRGYWKHGRRG